MQSLVMASAKFCMMSFGKRIKNKKQKELARAPDFFICWEFYDCVMLKKIFLKMISVFTYIWCGIALIPLFLGIFMIDILLKLIGVERSYLLLINFGAWCSKISSYLKFLKIIKNTIQEKKENV